MRDLDHRTIFIANLVLGSVVGMFVFGAVVLWLVGIVMAASVIIAFFVMVFSSYRMTGSANSQDKEP